MQREWNLQDAKARLSELVDRARDGEAQVILRRGEPAAVVISYEAYQMTRPNEKSVLSIFQGTQLSQLQMPARSEEPERDLDL